MKLKKNIVLIGMRGTGKTAIGKTLADFLKFDFIDIDHEIETGEGVKIPKLVAQHDWKYFRDIESKYTAAIAKRKNTVIATGGGVILRPKNITALKKNGIIVLIHSPLKHLTKRVARSSRPSLTGSNPTTELADIWNERREKYETAAHVTVKFNFETKNKKTDLIQKSKIILQTIHDIEKKHREKKLS